MTDNIDNNQFTVLDEINRVKETAEVIRAAAAAGENADVIGDAEEASEELRNVRELVEAVNSTESWNPSALNFLIGQTKAISKRLDIPQIDLGLSMEDIDNAPANTTVSVKGIDRVIAAVDNSAASLQERSVASLVELINSLGQAIPRLDMRINDLCQRACNAVDPESDQTVTFDDASIKTRLLVNNEIPVPFANFANEYCSYGQVLLGKYTDVSFQSVMKTTMFSEGMDQGSFSGFWECINDKISQIQDPRKELTEGQMSMTLPGAGSLFAGKIENIESAVPVMEKLLRFVGEYRPVSISDFNVEVQTDSNTAPALKPSEIRDTCKYLIDLLCVIDVDSVSQACKAAWIDAGRTIRQVKESLSQADESLLRALGDDDKLLPAYLETLFTLSAWPVLNYMTNLVTFGNAFVDYANRSMDPAAISEEPAESAGAATDGDDGVSTVDGDEISDTAVDVSTNEFKNGNPEPELEDPPAEVNGSEVPDTGMTPNKPQDATGDDKLAVVDGVDDTIAENAEEQTDGEDATSETDGATSDEAAGEDDADTLVELNDDDSESDTAVDVGDEEDEEDDEDENEVDV